MPMSHSLEITEMMGTHLRDFSDERQTWRSGDLEKMRALVCVRQPAKVH